MWEDIRHQLPPAPEGFTWQMHKNAVFLQPAGWVVRQVDLGSAEVPTSTYASSPADFSAAQPFETGLTVQIFSGSMRLKQLEAKKLAMAYLQPLLASHAKSDIRKLDQAQRGDFERTWFQYRDAPQGKRPVIVHKYVMANNVTDTVHVFTFETPEERWEADWAQFGQPIMSKVAVLPTVSPR